MRPKIKRTWLDRAVGFFAPIHEARRLHARTTLAMADTYTGASRSRRPTKLWSTSRGSANLDLEPSRPLLIERSRDLIRNSPLATGAVNTVCTNVVGTGLRLRSQIDREALGLEDEAADTWERAAEREFALWAKSADLTRVQNFNGLQDLILRSALENGDVFALKRFKERPGSPYGLKLQLVEADRISNPNKKYDTTRIAGGVEMDADGAPVAYHVQNSSPGESSRLNREWVRVPAFGPSGERLVYHVYRRLRVGQSRGIPYLTPVIEPLKQLSRYSEAEIDAAVIASLFAVFVKTEAAEGLAPFQPDDETGGSTSDEDYKLAPGAILDLRPGEDISTANPGRPNQSFDPFVQAILRQIGVALEIPFEILIKHFTASYSAARAAMLEAWKMFRTRRRWLVDHFCQPVFEAVIDEAIARGRLTAPKYFDDPLVRLAYTGSMWIGPAPGQIDPTKDIDAAKTALEIGVRTRAAITAEQFGDDWEQVNDQLAKENRMRQEGGLGPPENAETQTDSEPASKAGFSMPEDQPEKGDES